MGLLARAVAREGTVNRLRYLAGSPRGHARASCAQAEPRDERVDHPLRPLFLMLPAVWAERRECRGLDPSQELVDVRSMRGGDYGAKVHPEERRRLLLVLTGAVGTATSTDGATWTRSW